MSKLALISLFSLSFAATVLEGREILLENGKTVYLRSVDSSELANIEAIVGCSTRCASACVSFSQGQAAVQCAKHCGCSSLIDSKPSLQTSSLYEADVSVEVYFPQSESGTTEIFAEVLDEDLRVSIDSSKDTTTGDVYTEVTVNTEDGSSKDDELTVTSYHHAGEGEHDLVVSAEDPAGNSATLDVSHSHTSDNSSYTESNSASVTVTDPSGRSQENYVENNYTQVTDGNTTVYVQNTSATVGEVHYEETEVGVVEVNSTEGTAVGVSVSAIEWTSASQVFSGIYDSLVPFVLAAAFLLFVFFIYRKISSESVMMYKTSVLPVESSADYIRI